MLASGYFFKNIASFSCWCVTIVTSVRPHSIDHAFVDVLFFSLILIWYYLHVNDMPPKKKSRLITRSAKADLVFVFKWSKTITRNAGGVETDE